MSGFVKRHTVLVGAVAVFLPLALLIWLQYGWLRKLETASAIAEQATLENYLDTLASEVEYFYTIQAERALNLPASLFTQERIHKVMHHFGKKEVEGVRRFFVVAYDVEDGAGRVHIHNPPESNLPLPPPGAEVKAITIALEPWRMLSYKGMEVDPVSLSVDERDPTYRMILNPITDEFSTVVGVAGMIVDQDYFRDQLLPLAVEKSLPHFFAEDAQERYAVTVRDDNGDVILATADPGELDGSVKRGFDFLFTDWSLGIRNRTLTPQQWARFNFTLNLALSGLLVVVLVGGIFVALRTVSREMKLSQMKAEFVSNVSHELRTPLASVRVFGEFLRLGRVRGQEKVQEYGEYIETESRRLTQLINNILDFAKIESGGKIYEFRERDVATVVTETLRMFKVRLAQNGFRIRYDGPAAPLPPVRLDADALSQALCNLLDNAVKYSGESREIGVRLRLEGDDVVIGVSDDGVGISRDEQGKIFERFHRVSTGLVHDVKGSGLGLAIVHHIIQAHGGTITVESEPGKGSTFNLRLPIPETDRSVVPSEMGGVHSHA